MVERRPPTRAHARGIRRSCCSYCSSPRCVSRRSRNCCSYSSSPRCVSRRSRSCCSYCSSPRCVSRRSRNGCYSHRGHAARSGRVDSYCTREAPIEDNQRVTACATELIHAQQAIQNVRGPTQHDLVDQCCITAGHTSSLRRHRAHRLPLWAARRPLTVISLRMRADSTSVSGIPVMLTLCSHCAERASERPSEICRYAFLNSSFGFFFGEAATVDSHYCVFCGASAPSLQTHAQSTVCSCERDRESVMGRERLRWVVFALGSLRAAAIVPTDGRRPLATAAAAVVTHSTQAW